ncbi:MAG: metallophosphoesterase [Salinisphaera sp.]|jgi:uncharacterized protein (TIGR04168 family)|nr:metallophosphoesterase [Salinisphaera sp.]
MQIGIVGDIHAAWDTHDTAFFNNSDYDSLLFVGDLARITGSLPVARRLAELTKPSWVIPGNHDAVTLFQLVAELKSRPLAARVGAVGMRWRVARLAAALGPVRLGGYNRVTLADNLGLIIARPHAMGPDRPYFRPYLKRAFGVDDFQTSQQRLCALVNDSPVDLVFLAHNGPAGLGDTPDSLYGCDFDPGRGDFGDPDLKVAIDHARATGHRVSAVIAGHMHHRSKHTGEWRQTSLRRDNTLYINAARVPRIEGHGSRRHHIRLSINADVVKAHAVFVDDRMQIISQERLA